MIVSKKQNDFFWLDRSVYNYKTKVVLKYTLP